MNANTRYTSPRARDAHVWAIVLAGGEGTRLRKLTCDAAGRNTPKQFCSLNGGPSLLEQALARAQSVVAVERVVTIVAAAHFRHWQSSLPGLPPRNVIVEPVSRGAGVGVLTSALAIFNRDPHARILVLPSDHFVDDEAALANAMHTALEEVERSQRGVAILGVQSEAPDPELGYITAGAPLGGALRSVGRFVEKPTLAEASALCEAGALWNTFILACRVRSLIELCYARCPRAVQRLITVDPSDEDALASAYARLPQIDFSTDIAMGQEEQLAVLPAPPCGWSDLGTTPRVANTLLQHPALLVDRPTTARSAAAHVNLAQRLMKTYPDYLADLHLPTTPASDRAARAESAIRPAVRSPSAPIDRSLTSRVMAQAAKTARPSPPAIERT